MMLGIGHCYARVPMHDLIVNAEQALNQSLKIPPLFDDPVFVVYQKLLP